MIELLACNLNRNDEVPNIALAEKLCESEDKEGIFEIAEGLKSKKKAIANDCIKVLYEIGYRKPELIADYADDFITVLSSKNNRIVWGGMTALAYITSIKPDIVYRRLPEIISAYEAGSVITVDNSISVFAELCRADDKYQKSVFPLLLDHLARCRPKEIPQHAERMAVCINASNREVFISALDERVNELSEAQSKRVVKLKRTIST